MVRTEKEEWKASPSRGFAGMHADERPCASATRALPGASSTKRRGAEGRGGPWRRGACEGRSLSRERRPGALPQLQSALSRCRGRSRITRRFRHAGCESDGHRSTSGGVRRGAAPSELAKGVQGETAAIGRVSLHPFLYAAPRAADRGR